MLRQNLFHPDVDRKAVVFAKGKQQNAGGDLHADSLDFAKLMQAFFGRQSGYFVKIDRTVRDLTCRVEKIRRTKADLQRSKLRFACRREYLGARKRIVGFFAVRNRLAVRGTKRFNERTNARNIVVLRQNEGTKRLKRFLMQNAHPAAGAYRRTQILVLRKRENAGIVVKIQIKIIAKG